MYAFWKQRGTIIANEQYFSWRSLICLIIIYKYFEGEAAFRIGLSCSRKKQISIDNKCLTANILKHLCLAFSKA